MNGLLESIAVDWVNAVIGTGLNELLQLGEIPIEDQDSSPREYQAMMMMINAIDGLNWA